MRRRALIQTLFTAALSFPALPALAQEGRSTEWIVGYAAGGGSDVVARTVSSAMAKLLNESIIVSNKPGAATNIAAAYVAKSKDLSHTLLTADFATLAANPALFDSLQYDAEKDFAPIGMLARFPLLLVVSPKVPAQNYAEFVAWAKQQGGGVNFASAGIGSPHHLAGELLESGTRLKLIHTPYRGAAPAVQDLLGGQVPFGFIDTASVQQYISSGKLRALGVASLQRLKSMPSIPTLAEQGLDGFEAYAWQGLVAPAGIPAERAARLSKALAEALNSPEVLARFQSLALDPLPGTPAQMTAYAKQERERWGKLIRAKQIKLD